MSTDRTLRRELLGFAAVGAVGTAAYLAVYLALRTGMEAHLANVTARVAIAVPTTWVNGRRTFGSSASWQRICSGALVVLTIGTAISAVPLALEQAWLRPDDRTAEAATLVAATGLATVARFVLLRNWLFAPPTPTRPSTEVAQRRASSSSSTVQPAGS